MFVNFSKVPNRVTMSDDHDREDNDESLTAVKDLIPESRLAATGDFFVSSPVVCNGDDVYEVNLTNIDLKDRNDLHKMEPWMLPDTEIMFLRCIAGE